MYYSNLLSRAGLAVFLGFFLLLSVVSAAPLSVRDYSATSSDAADVSRHIMPEDNPRGIIHHTSAPVQSSQLTTPLIPASIFKRDRGDFQFDFPARRSFRSKMRGAFRKLESGVKHVENAVAHFVNDNKNKIAKVGLKVLSMAEQYGGKALSAIPVIGKPLSKGLEIASKFTNSASNRIHANLGGNLGKAMEGIDEAEHIADYVRR